MQHEIDITLADPFTDEEDIYTVKGEVEVVEGDWVTPGYEEAHIYTLTPEPRFELTRDHIERIEQDLFIAEGVMV